MDYPLVVKECQGIRVVRDDLVPGGTKARVIHLLFDHRQEYVYAGPCQGYAQVALAYSASAHGKTATIFCAARKYTHDRTKEAIEAGARMVQVPNGYLSVVQKRAKDYCLETGAVLLPFGLLNSRILDGIAEIASQVTPAPTEVWSVAGSGTLSLALQQAWTNATVNAVLIGQRHDSVGRAKLWVSPEKYEQDAKEPPPFSSCGNYDAKAWRFIVRHALPGALFWNVAS